MELQKPKKIELKNKVILTVKITSDYTTAKGQEIKNLNEKIKKEKDEVKQKELQKELKNIEKDNFDIIKLRGQWEGMNIIGLKFYNKKQFYNVKKLKLEQLIVVTGKIYNFFNAKEKRTFASILVESYKKIT